MRLEYGYEADDWLNGLPIGNGQMGAMVCSRYGSDSLHLNSDTLWSGYPHEASVHLRPKDIEQARLLTRQGRYAEATRLLKDKLDQESDEQIYEPFGTLKIDFDGVGQKKSILRSLDMAEATVFSHCSMGEASREMLTFCSAPRDMLVYQVASKSTMSGRVSFSGRFINWQDWNRRGEYEAKGWGAVTSSFALGGHCPGLNISTLQDGLGNGIPWEREGTGMAFTGLGIVSASGGSLMADSEGIRFCKVPSLTIYFMSKTGFNGSYEQPNQNVQELIKDLSSHLSGQSMEVEDIRQEHAADFQTFFHRVSVHFGSGDLPRSIDVPGLLKSKSASSIQTLTEVMFAYGRYLLISSSRPGTQPANLQGIWNDQAVPPWLSAYTTNINVEMNYWMTGPCDLHEMIEPLVDMNLELLKNGRHTAAEVFGSEGSAVFHNVDIWRKATPANGDPSWSFWPFGQVWMCRNLFDEFEFIQDRNYLKTIWPVMVESVRFCLGTMVQTQDGLAISPATSPENTFLDGGRQASVAEYTENTLALVRNLLRDFLEACQVLGDQELTNSEEQLRVAAKSALNQIVPIRITADGRIAEWNKDFPEVDPRHRHLSHLFELHPGQGITRATPKLWAAAEQSLRDRGTDGSGWSIIWRLMMWARLGNGSMVLTELGSFFRGIEPAARASVVGGGVYPNLLCAHPPFQIDGNLGFPAVVAEMLLQSHAGEIRVLPALPQEWSSGWFRGLRARGNIRVSARWSEDEVRVELESAQSTSVLLAIKAGPAQPVSWSGVCKLTFKGDWIDKTEI